MKILRSFLLAGLLASTQAPAADLPRRAFLGVGMASAAQKGDGAAVTDVIPGGTAAAIGLEPGDVVTRASGQRIAAPADLVAFAGRLREGVPVSLQVRRGTRSLALSGPAAGWPRERVEGARTDYGAVPWRGGQLRDILMVPAAAPDAPIVFLIQGFSCATVEPANPEDPYRRLGAALIAQGIGYYRVEKPGLGDSAGTPHCRDLDYATETDAFRAAYTHLIEQRGVDPKRIFFFGHSLGGLQAPMLAAERAPRGVAVYGTVLRNWADYHRDISLYQSYLTSGVDPVDAVASADAYRDLFRRFYMEREDPVALAAADPAFDRGLREAFGWDGTTNVFGRHFKYDQDLAHLPLMAAWRDAKSHVLSLYGASDLVALSDEDHRLIADVANFYRPGSALYVELADTGHGMEQIGSRAELRARNQAGGNQPPAPFNPKVAEALGAWVRDVMRRPPLAG